MKCKHTYGDYERVIFTECYGDQGRIVQKCSKCGDYKEIDSKLLSAIEAVNSGR